MGIAQHEVPKKQRTRRINSLVNFLADVTNLTVPGYWLILFKLALDQTPES